LLQHAAYTDQREPDADAMYGSVSGQFRTVIRLSKGAASRQWTRQNDFLRSFGNNTFLGLGACRLP
jgi:hypothetical protein